MKTLSFLLLFVCSAAFAAEKNNLQLQPSQVVCVQKRCSYSPNNISPSALVSVVKQSVFGKPDYTVNFDEGYIENNPSNTEVIFWHSDETVLALIKMAVVEQDKNILFQAKALIDLRVQIYSIKESALGEYGINLSGMLDGSLPAGTAEASLDIVNGLSNLVMNFGNLTTNLLKVKLDLARSKGAASEFHDYSIPAFNWDNISDERQKILYRDSNISTQQESAGFSMNGQVFISDAANLVLLKNFRFTFGTQDVTKNTLVNIVNLSRNNVVLGPNKPIAIYQQLEEKTESETKTGIFNFGKSNSSDKARLVIFLSANPRLFKEPEQTPEVRIDESTLPDGDEKSFENLMRSARVQMSQGFGNFSFGQKVDILFDQNLLTKNIYNKVVKIDFEGDGYDEVGSKSLRMDQLASQPFALPSVSLKNLKNPNMLNLKLKIQLHPDYVENKKVKGAKDVQYEILYLPEASDVRINKVKFKSGFLWF